MADEQPEGEDQGKSPVVEDYSYCGGYSAANSVECGRYALCNRIF